jgi:hypothetical protein
MAKHLLRVVLLTASLGTTVVASWMVVRGASVFGGPGPFLDPTWYLVWAVQATLASVVGMVAGRSWGRESSNTSLVAMVTLAWLGELVVAALLTPVLSGDLRLFHAPWVWLVATAGPVQPLAAIVGTLVGKASIRDARTRTAA